jgi:2-polyprenyl-3-methyl-5-hydroxy-6-metoxy-1,4-benzoquinol methylase
LSTFDEGYFKTYLNNPKRILRYRNEISFIQSYQSSKGLAIDFGCGLGGFMRELQINGWECLGFDVSQHAVSFCQQQGLRSELITKTEELEGTYNADLLVLRGVIQHLPDFEQDLSNLVSNLKPGGLLAILASPNCDSLVFRKFGRLPALEPVNVRNLPTARNTIRTLQQLNFHITRIRYPYLRSGYASPIKDLTKFLFLRPGGVRNVPSFYGNIMDILARKNY